MANVPRHPEPNEDTSTPRWVKVFGIVVIVLIVLFVILHLTGNGFSGLHGLIPLSSDVAIAIDNGIRKV